MAVTAIVQLSWNSNAWAAEATGLIRSCCGSICRNDFGLSDCFTSIVSDLTSTICPHARKTSLRLQIRQRQFDALADAELLDLLLPVQRDLAAAHQFGLTADYPGDLTFFDADVGRKSLGKRQRTG